MVVLAKVDINIFESNWIKPPPKKIEKLRELREKITKSES